MKAVETLAGECDLAANLYRKKLQHDRDTKRPKVGADEYRKLADRYRHLDSKGIKIDDMVARTSDPAALRVLQDEAESLTWGQTHDPEASEGPLVVLENKARTVYGDAYAQADDEIQAFDKGYYRVKVGINQAAAALRSDQRDDPGIPDYAEGLVDVA